MEPKLPDGATMKNGMKNQTSSAGRFMGKSIIWGKDGDHDTPYMTRYWIGRLRLHVFHRGDQDPDPHDHPWGFWTFPLTPYVEEVTIRDVPYVDSQYGTLFSNPGFITRRQVVPAFRWSYRPATHCHRVLGCWTGRWERPWPGRPHWSDMVESYASARPIEAADEPSVGSEKIITLVWRGKDERKWGFLKHRDGKWCWVHWKEYVFGEGGKSAPCE